MFNIQEELKKLPTQPGVYLMHNKSDEIIYVGKAINLRNRVRQYFRESTQKTSKIEKMVSNISYFEYIVTDSELEALILECNLIKEHNPKYNTMLKDGKTYPYIKVTVGEAFPRILFTREMKKDKAKYFGPYTSAGAVNDIIELLKKIYRIRSCNRTFSEGNHEKQSRACLNYHIGRCNAPCMDYVSKEEYRKSVEGAISFLSGDYKPVIKELEDKMYAASERMEFEEAASYRDLINSVKHVTQKQKITSEEMENRDIIACSSMEDSAVVQVFFIRDGRLIGREHFHMNIDHFESKESILSQFVKQYYGGTPFIPKELVIQTEIEDMELVQSWLSSILGQKVRIIVPKRGEKHKLVELAAKNASMVLEKDSEKIKREEARTIGAMKRISDMLGLPYVTRVEAFDISNTSGFQSVGSMVVYENGKPKRADYRKFKIKTVKGPDDYKSMKEVLTRRFNHGLEQIADDEESGFTRFPDLIMMDGGRGQVNIALEVLEELKLSIPVCGMVKDDHHRTRGLYFNNKEIDIDVTSEEFRLITRIQDEAHRFAIEYHKSLRGKAQVQSVLDDIEGIGPARRKALMRYFKSLEDIKGAGVEELMMADGINRNVAENIYNFFH
ncbi:MAG: excinuclease ABC subunit UvrC [Lachnospiraceae bacterium]|nr:excinuclease ABC subunit UvrC [Lachnospiraceae bacterium]